jgi:hypothetical protein
MMGFRRVATQSAVAASKYQSPMASRGFVSSRISQGGHGDHHDPNAPHPMWDNLPFQKSFIGPLIVGGVFLGVGITIFSVVFQNKKHGFPRKE